MPQRNRRSIGQALWALWRSKKSVRVKNFHQSGPKTPYSPGMIARTMSTTQYAG